ncbi:hypothetical protein DAPPUDRAFT_328600 [Daphnia pulex]|uniref:Uncharacterized protein n=1 Tax=Daphnia pulex TaxID=6669 RepID=E9HE67_DAPPU|nr:hypothetical protein DAPPUDRAFT_328600 [Daphnia pulex]|eukprot:EFX69959.1 hypothetical protein DAPPUDRAFT_328600 [Daphnia pulex]
MDTTTNQRKYGSPPHQTGQTPHHQTVAKSYGPCMEIFCFGQAIELDSYHTSTPIQ